MIEAAQSCREGVESTAFLRHLCLQCLDHTLSLGLKGRGLRASERGPLSSSCAAPARRPSSGRGSEPAPAPRPGWDFSPLLKPIRSSLPCTQCQKFSCDQTCFLMKF